MTLPVVQNQGGLGTTNALGAGETFEARDWRPPTTARSTTFYVRTNVGGNVRIRRISDAADLPEAQACPTVTIPNPPPAADGETVIKINAPPLGVYRVFFDNTAPGVGVVSIEATWEAST